jgi:Protein kinase domain
MRAHSGEERLGPYCLREQLGEGGMGVVYLASDPADRLVAVKVLRQGIPAAATARRRLAREVETMRRVHSPYVAEVIDADVEGSQPYIVTRYVAGRTLEEVVEADGPLAGHALASLACGLASALAAVHAAGVVHRDLKPGNVMIVGDKPVVIDFGIAHAADSTKLTMTGMFMGTPGYLAPEVIEGGPSGPAADVHSWGATMAYAATGNPPFGTGQFEAIFYRIVHGQPGLDTMPAPLLPLVLAALSRDPASRPSAAGLTELTARLVPELLVRRTATIAAAPCGQQAMTAHDLPPQPGGPPAPPAWPVSVPAAAGAALAAARPAPPPVRPGTIPIGAAPRDDFADLLTPVRYDQPRGFVPPPPGPVLAAGGLASAGGPGAVVPAGFGGTPRAAPRGARSPAAAAPGPARVLLVLATVAALVSLSVLLPVAGTAVALTVLILLRAADVTSRWLSGRRAALGPRRTDLVSTTAFFPWAVVRSVLSFLLLAPLALLFAVAAATLAVLAAGTDELPRTGGYALGALVACYSIGPGSAACRRPLSRFYGRLTRSGPSAVLGTVALVALAAVAIGAALTMAPGYWPAGHLGHQLQTASILHPSLAQLPDRLSQAGRRLMAWLGLRTG